MKPWEPIEELEYMACDIRADAMKSGSLTPAEEQIYSSVLIGFGLDDAYGRSVAEVITGEGRAADEELAAQIVAAMQMVYGGDKPYLIPPNILTCVYCGTAYPEGTPSSGSQILTDHIKTCEKHPMRAAEAKIIKLRTALMGLIGVSTREEMREMEIILRAIPGIEKDKIAATNAIHALIDTEE